MKNSKGKIPIINSSEQYLIWLFLKIQMIKIFNGQRK